MIAEVVAIFGDEMIGVARVLLSELLHEHPNIFGPQIRCSNENRLSESEARAVFGLHFKNSRRVVLVRTKTILNTVNLNSRMVDTKAKPIGIAINWSEIIDVEVNGDGARFVLAWP